MNRARQLDSRDNVMVALSDLPVGTFIGDSLQLVTDVKAKHKFALADLSENDTITMYGVPVGKALRKISKGEVLTTNNIAHYARNPGELNSQEFHWRVPEISPRVNRTFLGYHRSNGTVGTRNVWLVIPLVFCENKSVRKLEETLRKPLGYGATQSLDVSDLLASVQESTQSTQKKTFEQVDAIQFLNHQTGCGGTRADAELLAKLIAGYLANPNTAGATLLSLGCQNTQIPLVKKALTAIYPDYDRPVYFVERQQFGEEKDYLRAAVKSTLEGLARANTAVRQPAPTSKIVLGLECGGSDGFSGFTANRLLGMISDDLSALGGTAILAEFPELHGVEAELAARCTHPALRERFLSLMESYHNRVKLNGSSFESNPSPGNIREGLITDAMKSAGAARKGGTGPITAVLDYTEQATQPGLTLLCTPGNDVESTTALAASGANLIVFTTGLGTPTGNPVAPVVKLSSNSELFQQMPDIIDFDAGPLIQPEINEGELREQFFYYLIRVASGTLTCAEKNDQADFIPWKRDISL